MAAAETLYEKIWNNHVVEHIEDDLYLVHIDRHFVHECTSGRAFAKLEAAGRKVRNPDLNFGIIDHILSTEPGRDGDTYEGGREFVHAMRANCERHGIELIDVHDPRQGIVHVVAPELGISLPGTTLVCGDSHTSTCGGLGCFAWGIGTSEVEHVLATQTLLQRKSKTMRINFHGEIGPGVYSKDLVLHLIGKIGVAAGRGHVAEYAGPAIDAMGIDERLTICNMSIEFGSRAGLIAPDQRTIDYLEGRAYSPSGAQWDQAVAYWRELKSDDGCVFDREVDIDCSQITPQVTWGTTPQDVFGVDGIIPDPSSAQDEKRRQAMQRSLNYLDLEPGKPLAGTPIDVAFIGSCTNGRLADIEAAARIVQGRKVAPNVRAMVVPGSAPVKHAAEAMGLDQVFLDAGFEWREAGCSMCVAINDDFVAPGKRAISSTNRNFEGRQGPKSRTHLASPATVAASAIAGSIADVRQYADGGAA